MEFSAIVTEIIRETSYRLDDFYNKTYCKGGPTLSQVGALYDEIQKAKEVEFRFQATIHGVEIKDDLKPPTQKQSDSKEPVVPLFGNPEAYVNLTDQEKEDLTSKMLNKHRSWSGNKLKGN